MAAAARQLASRSIHLKIQPTACSFSERREIIRVLERFGEVEMFKSLKYDSTTPVRNAFLSILSTEEAAQAAIAASPIRYCLITDTDATTSQRTPSQSNSASTNGEAEIPLDPSKSHTATPDSPPIFELHVSPSMFPHHLQISSSLLWGPYTPMTPRLSAIAADLSSRVPESISKPGLVDWVTGSATDGMVNQDPRPWRLRRREKELRESQIPPVMKGLVGLRERNAIQRTKREWKEGTEEKENESGEKPESMTTEGEKARV